GWFIKVAEYIGSSNTRASLVSTNSITQGEQVAPLWSYLFSKGIIIYFAYRTFPWESEAKGKAAVHVVIIGLTNNNYTNEKKIFSNVTSNEISEIKVANISPYLIEGPNLTVGNRSKPICNVPEMATGNKPIDDGQYIFSDEEKADFLKVEPDAQKYFLQFIGADEFLNAKKRWILFLKDITPKELKEMPNVLKRVEAVRAFRLESTSIPTNKLASFPTRFHTENLPLEKFMVIPQVSSERREYIPIGYIEPPIICSDKLRILCSEKLYHFGVLESKMHMVWMRLVTGRLKSDYQYSVLTVYNNFPWPETPSDKQIETVEAAAQKVLDTRAQFPNSSLADLYDPLTMPPDLVKAHQELDKAVDLCYRPQPFINETKRIEYLFELYDKYTAGLFAVEKKVKRAKS
ncbi:MAG: class I SAM-dependent DNA methyltransferase, partial [Bacteroidetes bacterium]|nr:class I SAM-dependent DNA methyltransferase [Bacteroidota bacterium]